MASDGYIIGLFARFTFFTLIYHKIYVDNATFFTVAPYSSVTSLVVKRFNSHVVYQDNATFSIVPFFDCYIIFECSQMLQN